MKNAARGVEKLMYGKNDFTQSVIYSCCHLQDTRDCTYGKEGLEIMASSHATVENSPEKFKLDEWKNCQTLSINQLNIISDITDVQTN